MKKQIVKLSNTDYMARYKKWWQTEWRYVNKHSAYRGSVIREKLTLCLYPTQEKAEEVLNIHLQNFKVVKEL